MVRLVNADMRPQLARLSASTLIIWGDQDRETPLNDARTMEALIPDAGLVVFAGAGHFAYAEQPRPLRAHRRRVPSRRSAMSDVLEGVLVALAAAAWFALLARVGLVAARMYQIEEYEERRLFGWALTPAWLLHRSVVAAAVAVAVPRIVALVDGGWQGARPLLAAGGSSVAWRGT